MNARDYAVLTLDEKNLPGMPRQAFKRQSPKPPADPRDRALAEHIVAGVVKNYKLLETLLVAHADRPISQIDPRAGLILLVALYQLRFLDRVPDHAVVAEAVRQTRGFGEVGFAKAGGFVNAILRQALREPDVPLPTRDGDPAGYAEVVLSHPRALVEQLVSLLGANDMIRFCEHDNRTPPALVRFIGTHATSDLLEDNGEPALAGGSDSEPEPTAQAVGFESENARVAVRAHEQKDIAVVEGAKQADYAKWAEAGVAQVQDATSAGTVAALDVRAGMTVLDRCCGVGTKTQQLAELVGPGGRVFAVDALGSRVSTLRRLAARRGDLKNVTAKRAEWMGELPADWPAVYDRVLIDAPCSNSGVLARRPEARYAQHAAGQAELAALQLKLLADAWPCIAVNGLLAYATCSVWPGENGDIVRAFLADHDDAELVSEKSVWPSFETDDPARYHDGGYVAVLRKIAASDNQTQAESPA